MNLQEFVADQKDLIDDFAHQYEGRRKRGKDNGQTLFRPEQQWIELLEEFLTYRREMLNGESEIEKAA